MPLHVSQPAHQSASQPANPAPWPERPNLGREIQDPGFLARDSGALVIFDQPARVSGGKSRILDFSPETRALWPGSKIRFAASSDATPRTLSRTLTRAPEWAKQHPGSSILRCPLGRSGHFDQSAQVGNAKSRILDFALPTRALWSGSCNAPPAITPASQQTINLARGR